MEADNRERLRPATYSGDDMDTLAPMTPTPRETMSTEQTRAELVARLIGLVACGLFESNDTEAYCNAPKADKMAREMVDRFAALPVAQTPEPPIGPIADHILVAALEQAAEWFEEYAEIHARKGDERKRERNQARASACRSWMTSTYQPTPDIGDARAEALADLMAERHFLGSPITGSKPDPSIVMVPRDWYDRLRALASERPTEPREPDGWLDPSRWLDFLAWREGKIMGDGKSWREVPLMREQGEPFDLPVWIGTSPTEGTTPEATDVR